MLGWPERRQAPSESPSARGGAAWIIGQLSFPSQALIRAISTRSAMVFATATRRGNAPEPDQGSLNVAWGVATFAIIAVLALAQLSPMREGFLAAAPAREGALAGRLADSSATPGADRQLYTADPSAGADPAAATAAPSARQAIAATGPTATAAPIDGSPEPVPSVIAPSATALVVQPTAAPTSAPVPTVQPATALAPVEVVAPSQVVSTVLDPITTAVVAPLTTVTTVTTVTTPVTTAVTTPVAAVASASPSPSPTTSTSTPTGKNTSPGGGTTTRVR